jgi:hypothetical protein
MTGRRASVIEDQTPGVFSWHVPPALVTDLSDLLDGVLS